MFHKRNQAYLTGIMACLLLAFGALPWGEADEPGASCEVWRDFGRLLLYRFGTGRYLSAAWLSAELDAAEPDPRRVASTAKGIFVEVLNGYGRDAIAVVGRIPLDINPRCIVGMHLAEQFSGTAVGYWGARQFDQCIEQACLAAMPASRTRWRDALGAELLTVADAPARAVYGGVFSVAEAPYLYHYLISNADSTDAGNEATERLAHCLWRGYGLEPGLRQYLVLFNRGCDIEGDWLEVASLFERTGANSRAKEIYERILRTTSSGGLARTAFESLARILLVESRQRQARSAYGLLAGRFPDVKCAAPDIKEFLREFEFNRMRTATGLSGRLATVTSASRALQLCRVLDALWSPSEAVEQWQAIAGKAEPGSLANQFGRVFLARAMLGAGNAESSAELIHSLAESSNPLVKARSLAVLAEIAQSTGDTAESERLYSSAVKVDRPTALPRWHKELLHVESPGAALPESRLQARAHFLRGCNDLIDGDYAAAVDSLCHVAQDPGSLPDDIRSTLPCMMMLAWIGLGDPAEAEAWGYRATGSFGRNSSTYTGTSGLSPRIQQVDVAVSRLLARVRDCATGAPCADAALQDAVIVCDAVMRLEDFVSHSAGVESDVRRMYVGALKRHLARVLEAEYDYGTQELAGSTAKGRASGLDSVFFLAQILGGQPFDRIKERLATAVDADAVNDRMYRLALFAWRAKHLDLAQSALDCLANEQFSAVSTEVLEKIAEMYLAFSNHQKAVGAYEKVVAKAKDPRTTRTARLKIIDIYAETLKNYEKAIQECQRFVRMHPDSVQTSQVEFLLGKLSYLSKDYAGAVGQLDGFWRRYPNHPQVGQAMLLAGLSRMAEGNVNEAIGRFTETIRKYPDGDLAARSKFLIGYAQLSGQRYGEASETLRQLIEQFPESKYVSQAQTLLERLNKVSQ